MVPLQKLVLALNASPFLETVELDFSDRYNDIEWPVAEILAGLNKAQNIRELRLNLPGCELESLGATHLSDLKFSVQLETLNINLRGNDMCALDFMKIGELKEIRTLNTLCIDLGGNRFSGGLCTCSSRDRNLSAIESLADFRGQIGIRTVALGLAACGIPAMTCFRVLEHSIYLRHLELDLAFNTVGDTGVHALVETLKQSRLVKLHLSLNRNAITDQGAIYLSELNRAPALDHLHLMLASNEIGDIGALALSIMKDYKPSPLDKLYVELTHNHVTHENLLEILNGDKLPALLDMKENFRDRGYVRPVWKKALEFYRIKGTP
jgi:hypothetical protein